MDVWMETGGRDRCTDECIEGCIWEWMDGGVGG
jgi:hypothetical protein